MDPEEVEGLKQLRREDNLKEPLRPPSRPPRSNIATADRSADPHPASSGPQVHRSTFGQLGARVPRRVVAESGRRQASGLASGALLGMRTTGWRGPVM